MRAKFNKIKALAESKGYVLEDCLVGKYSYQTYKKEDNYWNCLMWRTLDAVENALNSVVMMDDINHFHTRDC